MRTSSMTIDGFGRLVIPKAARDRHGLLPGTVVELEDSPPGILLRPAVTEVAVRWKDGILVLTAPAASNLDDLVRTDRTARSKHLSPKARR